MNILLYKTVTDMLTQQNNELRPVQMSRLRPRDRMSQICQYGEKYHQQKAFP